MPVRKRNEFLDDGNETDDAGNSSDDNDRLAKSRIELASRAAKRRRRGSVSDGDSGEDYSDRENTDKLHEQGGLAVEEQETSRSTSILGAGVDRQSTLQTATLKSLAKAEKAARKSGVLYISRVPPFMKPHTLKHFLEPHASKGLGRIFLTPEDHNTYLSRKKNGGNKKKSYTDGWVEFASKTEAKTAAEILNGNIMGGKKGGYYHDDLWNIKYLSGFKWSHLTDQIVAENAEREARMREEIRRTRKENKAFLEDYERGKMLETMDKKRAAKGIAENDDQRAGNRSRTRTFKQIKARPASTLEPAGESGADGDDANLKRTLGMIF